ncbi:hypothetical protein MIND_00919300 [Mycena indigotica]|uniref:DUF6534 domain-containing protein n=1 Tax=Mycena indigotica TaxID=2126181 RepID=A0A8H6SCE6_9AGAR|nr:uncharacterized protein MIND_00919300 [Mycena indigotica]KAF7296878.1 hypothetical protein MIND_00919300 [Mycena indigotica]
MADLELLTGPMLAGTQANWLLLGTLTLQVYKFFVCFPKERAWIKAMVYTLFILECTQTGVTSHFAYSLLVLGWGNPAVFAKLPWSSLATPIFTGITSATVQIFFAWRIYTLKGEHLLAKLVCVLIVMASFLGLMSSLAAFVTDGLFAVTTELSKLPPLMTGVKVWLIGSAVCDVLITISMLIILTQYRMKTPWKRTDSIITKLIYNVIETGAITTIVAVADVTLFIVSSQTNLHQTPAFMLGKLYTNVLLATLNARAVMGTPSGLNAASGDREGTHGTHEMNWRGQRSNERDLESSGVQRKVQISTVTRVTTDSDQKDRYGHADAKLPAAF